jgi:predicted acyltransferase
MPDASKPDLVPSSRLGSIDALRGFDMFWITGGEEIFHSLHRVVGSPLTNFFHTQLQHVAWEGFRFYDLIFPLFLFIVGLVLPFSLTRRLERGESRGELYRHLARRLALLFLLGLVHNGLLDLRFHELRIPGVLQRIAICYFVAGLIVMNAGMRGQAMAAGAILIAYWAIIALVPVPGFGAGVITPEGNLAGFLDRMLLPQPFCCYQFGDNEGILSTLPAVATTLLGVMAGHWLRSGQSPQRKASGLALAGVACLILGNLWGLGFPVIKNIWTSSYVLVAAGWSSLLVALFYWIIDVRGWRRWSFFFTVIGMNPITIYVLRSQFNFVHITRVFVRGFINLFSAYAPVAMDFGVMMTGWLFLYFLYRKKMFLKV